MGNPWDPRSLKDVVKGIEEREYDSIIKNILYGFTRNPADIEDLTQDVYMKIVRHFKSYEKGTNFKAWICRITKNTGINEYRKQRNQHHKADLYSVSLEDIEEDYLPAFHQKYSIGLQSPLDEEMSLEVKDALENLPPDYKTVLELCDLQDLRYEEVAKTLGIPVGTVMSRLFRARIHMARTLLSYVMPNKQEARDANTIIEKLSATYGIRAKDIGELEKRVVRLVKEACGEDSGNNEYKDRRQKEVEVVHSFKQYAPIVKDAYNALPKELKTILNYNLRNYKNVDIAKKLDMHQYTVSKKIGHAKRRMAQYIFAQYKKEHIIPRELSREKIRDVILNYYHIGDKTLEKDLAKHFKSILKQSKTLSQRKPTFLPPPSGQRVLNQSAMR